MQSMMETKNALLSLSYWKNKDLDSSNSKY